MRFRGVAFVAVPAVALLIGLTTGRAADTKDADAAERAKLVGVWRGFTVEGKGENPDRGPVKLEITITADKMKGIEIKGENRIDHGEGTFTLALDTDPRRLDASQTNAGGRQQVYVGIYQLEGDTLKWCVSPRKVRPTTFETVKGQFLLILKRDKRP